MACFHEGSYVRGIIGCYNSSEEDGGEMDAGIIDKETLILVTKGTAVLFVTFYY